MVKIRKSIIAIVVSTAGIGGIALHEGFRENAYVPIPGDKVTIGYGSTTYEDGSKVKMGDKITRQKAEELLGNKVNMFERQVKSCVKVPLAQNEYDAFVSLTYNIGGQAFCSSTLVKKLNVYDYEGACNEILKWDKFRGKPLPGLTKRRQQENKQCLGV